MPKSPTLKAQITARLEERAREPLISYPAKFGPKYQYEPFQFVVVMTKDDPNVLRAFRMAGLDPRDMWHWWELLGAFCDVYFSSKPGRPKTRTDEACSELFVQYEEIVSRQRSPSMIDACRILQKLRNDRRAPSTLKKILQARGVRSHRKRTRLVPK